MIQTTQTKKIVAYKNKIISGDCFEVLKNLQDSSVDLVITSPPYFQQRDYGNGSFGVGNEETEKKYLEKLAKVFDECMRVTRETGAIVFNLGDKYLNGNLALLPYKFAIKAAENKQVSLINQLTWAKLNPTPRQEKRKLIQAIEPFFIFAKSKDYYFDLENYLSHLDEINKNGKNNPSQNLGGKYFELIKSSDLDKIEKQNAKNSLTETIKLIHQGEIIDFRVRLNFKEQVVLTSNESLPNG